MGTLETSSTATLAKPRDAVDAYRERSGLTWLAVCALGAATALLVQIGADARWLAALGAHVASTWTIPDGLPYAATSSAAWENAPVLGQLVFHALYSALADRGLVLGQVAAVVVALIAVARDMRAGGAADTSRAVVLFLTVLAAAPALLIVRAQLFSIALFPLLLLLLRADARQPTRRIWLIVPLLAIWANLHGGVLVGLLLTATYILFHRVRRRKSSLAVLAAAALAVLATPARLGTIGYYHDVLTGEVAARAAQLWAPLSLHRPFDVLFLLVAIPLVALMIRGRPPAWEVVALAGLAAMAVQANRNTVWFALFIAAPAARGVRLTFGSAYAPVNVAFACVLAVAGLAAAFRAPVQTAAGPELLRQTEAAAAGRPVLADPLNGEQLALAGQTIRIGNPLDAFARNEQRLYLDWLEGLPRGDRILTSESCAVLVATGSAPERRLSTKPAYRKLRTDAVAALYERTTC